MNDYSKQDAEIKKLYDKFMVQRITLAKADEERRKHMGQNIADFVEKKLQFILSNILVLEQDPRTPPNKIEELHRDFSKTLDIVNSYLMPEVIDHLVMNEYRKRNNEKILNAKT